MFSKNVAYIVFQGPKLSPIIVAEANKENLRLQQT